MEPALDPGRDDTHALLALVLAGGAAAPRLRLLECHAAPAAAWRAGPAAWREAGLDARQIARLGTPDRERAALGRAWLDLPGHHLIGWRAPQFPPLLAAAPQPPLALFVEGDPALLWRAQLAVVGARAATAGGLANARLFALAFAHTGWCVASGMAAGIDAAAHRAVLEAGHPTVAVLGTGPDLAYPRHHAGLREAIAAHGALVSEHPPGTAARAAHFPARNRILAGLALGTVVVEAALRSGALITARLAAEAGREVFALPGSIHNPMARGCHRLIRDGVALVETPDQVLEDMAAALTRYAPARPHSGRRSGAARRRSRRRDGRSRLQPLVVGPRTRPNRYGRTGRAHRIDARPAVLHAAGHGTGWKGGGRPRALPARTLVSPPPQRPRDAGRGAMKESILDVLLYLFEHYFSEDADLIRDRDSLQNGLIQAGFSPAEISKAFDWLDALAEQRPELAPARVDGPVRVYHGAELDRLDTESRGFLLFLEQHGILSADQRELVVDRAMALDQDELDLDDLKWVVLMVLFNQPGAEAAYAWMETQMFLDEPEPVH